MNSLLIVIWNKNECFKYFFELVFLMWVRLKIQSRNVTTLVVFLLGNWIGSKMIFQDLHKINRQLLLFSGKFIHNRDLLGFFHIVSFLLHSFLLEVEFDCLAVDFESDGLSNRAFCFWICFWLLACFSTTALYSGRSQVREKVQVYKHHKYLPFSRLLYLIEDKIIILFSFSFLIFLKWSSAWRNPLGPSEQGQARRRLVDQCLSLLLILCIFAHHSNSVDTFNGFFIDEY